MTKEKAKHFAKMLNIPEDEQPEFSNGWLHSFQLRHNFSSASLIVKAASRTKTWRTDE
ncbi:hypothetical protein PINS_up015961 [Pythium insidiosum]|nr:hypothetical protein PINS_up015961 [Pythium insidiosum]